MGSMHLHKEVIRTCLTAAKFTLLTSVCKGSLAGIKKGKTSQFCQIAKLVLRHWAHQSSVYWWFANAYKNIISRQELQSSSPLGTIIFYIIYLLLCINMLFSRTCTCAITQGRGFLNSVLIKIINRGKFPKIHTIYFQNTTNIIKIQL